MKNQLKKIKSALKKTERTLQKDEILSKDIDNSLDFIMPFCNAEKPSNIKLVIIGQDPTVRNKNSRKNINITLNLDKNNSLKTYLKDLCEKLDIDIETEVYATNLYKCFFNEPPADNKKNLTRHFKLWMDLLINELKPYKNAIFITLGEPIIEQLIHTGSKKVKHFWDYVGNTKSEQNFKFIDAKKNYLQKNIFPMPHQPTWSRKKFYKNYYKAYVTFIKQS